MALSMTTFLVNLTNNRHIVKFRIGFGQFKRFAYELAIKRDDKMLNKDDWKLILEPRGFHEVARILRGELKALVKTPCFGAYSMDETAGSLTHMDQFIISIQKKGTAMVESPT